jgi:hypothetical protein
MPGVLFWPYNDKGHSGEIPERKRSSRGLAFFAAYFSKPNAVETEHY